MNIKFLCRRHIPGEAWTNRILAYAKGLSELGCEVDLYYLITDNKRTLYTISIPGVRIINLWENDNIIERKLRIFSYIRNLYRFHCILKKGDKVFVYGNETNLIKASLKHGVDVYVEITEHPYKDNTKGERGEVRIDKESKKLNRLNGLAVISHKLRDYFKSVGVDENKLVISNMFVDSQRFKIEKDKNVEPYIAYCGIISVDKDGVDTLIKAFALFHKDQSDYKLYIIGRFGSEEVRKTLEQLIFDQGVGDSVVFTGQVSPEDMPKLLVNARILALARPNNLQAQSGFPTKLGEYLSTGNPAVVTAVGEIPLFIKDGYNAYLSEPDNPEEFARKLSYVADNYEKAKEVGQRGKELVKTVFSYKSQSKVLYELMNK